MICNIILIFFFVVAFPNFSASGDQRQLLQADRAGQLVRQVPPHAKAQKNRRHPHDPAQCPHDGSAVRPAGEALPKVLRQVSEARDLFFPGYNPDFLLLLV